MANIIEITVKGNNLLKPTLDEVNAQARAIGKQAGTDLGKQMAQGIDESSPAVRDAVNRDMLAKMYPNAGWEQAGEGIGKDVGDGVSKGVEPGLADMDRKVGDQAKRTGSSAGQKAGNGFAGGMSPLILGAFGAVATAGPGVLVTATAAAVVGAAALVNRGNAQMQAGFAKLGADGAQAVQDATLPLVPNLEKSLTILDQGVAKTGTELTSVFQAASPYAMEISRGLVALVDNALPGLATLLKDAAPYAHEIAVDFGNLGSGVSGLLAGLGGGAQGGMQGFSALVDILSHLLTDIGQIVGALSQGLGPALHDVDAVAVPVAAAFTEVVKALPPGAIRAAADSVMVLMAAFQLGKLGGVVQEGTTFLQFVKGSGVAAEESAGKVQKLGAGVLGAASSFAGAAVKMLPFIGAAAIVGQKLDDLYKSSHDAVPSVEALASTMQDAAAGSGVAQDQVTQFAQAITAMPFKLGAAGVTNLDQALAQLVASNPKQAATEFYQISYALEAQGKSAGDVAKMFPQYQKALDDAKVAVTGQIQGSVELTSALSAEAQAVATSASQTAAKVLADLGATDGTNKLTIALNAEVTAYEEANTQASAYKTVLDALYGKYQSYSDAQATFTTDLDNATKGLKASKDGFDTNTAAGAANYQLMSTLATANENRAEALLRETGSQDQANKSLQQGALQIDALAKSAHFSQGQIDALNIALYGTAKIGNIKVSVGVDTSRAVEGVSGLLHWINSTSATVAVNYGGPAHAGFAHGGVVGAAASGGPRGNLTWINEQGPELVRLPSGATVFSNPDTMRMLGGASGPGFGWDGTIRMVWDGPADMSWLFTLISQHVRAVAGNRTDSVQVTFGQGF